MPTNLFFALELSEPARETVYALAQRWREQMGERNEIRWYRPEDYHITLKFLGPREPCEEDAFVPAGEIAAERYVVAHGLDVAVSPAPAGGFPDLSRPRVLWAGVEKSPALIALMQTVDTACEQFGVPPEQRGPVPHITLARCRGNVVAAPPAAELLFTPFVQNRFVLMRTADPNTRRTGAKVRYTIVRTFAFPSSAATAS